jgi:transcriptional regulator with XRE-family HTH domain
MKKVSKSDSNSIRPEDKIVGDMLAAARIAANLKQEDVAKRAGWFKEDGSTPHQQRVSHYETGRRRITVIDLFDYAKALQMSPADIIGIKRIPVSPKE